MQRITRRKLLGTSGVAAGSVTLGLPLLAALATAEEPRVDRTLKVVVAGGHPDDPETGCGGTMALYSKAGHDVVALYLTRGEAGILGKTHQEAANIRTAEAGRACEILGARPLFAGQIDGDTEVNRERYDAFRKLLAAEKPDLILTHWPIDSHLDHRAAALLVYDAWGHLDRSFALYYFEVLSGSQTQIFHPTDYVDITATEDRKRAACFAHASQGPEKFYAYHDKMNQFRGMESRCKYAEAFVRQVESTDQPFV